ncbi:hypothetical protein H4S07_002568 [Coemansia furcata]|uniref:Uncharacterized protein n=1 Tax=Coemansia furcata TaxID=417177 RepID=A0ACC1LL82_9FUNG|nr:hypothetical protein H4S07_002568 [Coemansia furcata]
MSDIDDFYTARNLLYLGAYPQALANLSGLPRTCNELELKSLQYRAYLGQGNTALVLAEISLTAHPTLLAIRHLALKDAASTQTLASDAANQQSATFAAIAAQTLASAGLTDDALRLLDQHPRSLECVLLTVAIYLTIDRVDLAQKLVARARTWSDDAPLAQLAEAWTALAQGKVNEAHYALLELAQASSVDTARLYCALAVTKMHLAQYAEAEALLQSALEKDPNHPDTLANLAICASLSANSAARARYLSQLAHAAPAHPFLLDLDMAGARFDAALAQVK